ncbi:MULTISPECIES: hypothetical protein [unclassified Psychrobacter]|uniref:hypothetical protein n=1 Tax=unclassified Psychrobacter TaxID=196806 RepID=UPI0017885A86|nr:MULTISPECIES: hypothetical protein [unclassified Psychrobacter]MBE0442375.1 hypothetical protein [Psychrobacter sp. FME13]
MGKIFEISQLLTIFAMIVLPIVMVYKHQFSQKSRLASWQIFLIGTFLVWLLVQVGVYFTDAYLQAQLDVFDLDDNGSFSSDERSEAQQQAMMRVTSDTGRALAPVTGAIFAFGYMSILIMFFKLLGIFTKKEPSIEA